MKTEVIRLDRIVKNYKSKIRGKPQVGLIVVHYKEFCRVDGPLNQGNPP